MFQIEENGRGCRPKKFTIYEAITWNLLACKNAYSWELKLLVMVMKNETSFFVILRIHIYIMCNAVAEIILILLLKKKRNYILHNYNLLCNYN